MLEWTCCVWSWPDNKIFITSCFVYFTKCTCSHLGLRNKVGSTDFNNSRRIFFQVWQWNCINSELKVKQKPNMLEFIIISAKATFRKNFLHQIYLNLSFFYFVNKDQRWVLDKNVWPGLSKVSHLWFRKTSRRMPIFLFFPLRIKKILSG